MFVCTHALYEHSLCLLELPARSHRHLLQPELSVYAVALLAFNGIYALRHYATKALKQLGFVPLQL